jgi:Putative peptidoglycan binding domain
MLAAIAAILIVAAAAAAYYQYAHRGHTNNARGADTSTLATVTQRTLSSQTQVNGTLGYAGSYSVVNQAKGTFTALPAAGQVVKQGDVLYRVDGAPVVLLYGSTPAYRSLSAGAKASDVTGADVAELNADLVALGYATSSELDPTSDQFGWWTKYALKKLQAHLGIEQTGSLALGQAVFLPSAIRITTVSATLGTASMPGGVALQATSTTRTVQVALSASQQSEVKVGDSVTIILPRGKTTPGTVSSVGTVATAPSSGTSTPTITVEITPTSPADTGSLDQAPVQVSITTASVPNALAVPVAALVALAGDAYAVETVNARGVHRLVPVTLGLFDDAEGLVQVSGTGLAAGQRIVVPSA